MPQAITKSLPFVVLLGTAAYLFALTLRFEFPTAPGRLGPDIWPQMLLVLLMLACAAGIGRNVLSRDREQDAPMAAEAQVDAAQASDEGPSRYGLVVGGMILFLAYPFALEYVGFVLATFLLMALFMWVGQWRYLPGIALVAGLGTLALFYLFRGVVYVSLPLGRGVFLDWTVWLASILGMR